MPDVEKASIGLSFASNNAYIGDFPNMSDEELVALGKEERSHIEDFPTLIRIGKISSELLSCEQQKLIKEFEENHLLSRRVTVAELLSSIRDCNDAQFVFDPDVLRNHKALFSLYPGIHERGLLKSLEVSDCVATRAGGDCSVFCDDLFVFVKTVEVPDGITKKPKDLNVSVKIDRDLSDGTTVAFVKTSVEDKPVEHIGSIDMVVWTDDTTSYIAGTPDAEDIYCSADVQFSGMSREVLEEKLGDMSDLDMQRLDVVKDIELLKDIALLGPKSRARMTEKQRDAVNAEFDKKGLHRELYRIDLENLVDKLHKVEGFRILNEARSDKGFKSVEFIGRRHMCHPGANSRGEHYQILKVPRSLSVDDFEPGTISCTPKTHGSYIYVAKLERKLRDRSSGEGVAEPVKLFIRVVEGYYPERDSKVILISFPEEL